MTELNTKLIREIVDAVEADPKSWDQQSWVKKGPDVCNTRFCFAGWAFHLSGYLDEKGRPNYDAISHAVEEGHNLDIEDFVNNTDSFPWTSVGADLLGIDYGTAQTLFDSDAGNGKWEEYKNLLRATTGVTFPEYEISFTNKGVKVEQWFLNCSECGRVFDSGDGSAEAHDAVVRAAAQHDKDIHNGPGTVDTSALMLGPEVAA
jgi:hypothetical protein